jgi:excinuclease ABC subunit C
VPSNVIPKVQALVAQIASMEVTVTRSETEALLLEHNLIKALHPRYNVVLRDDKSFPYLWLSGEHAFPRLSVYRGSRNLPGRFFGPYPNAGAVGESLHYLQRLSGCATVATPISRTAADPACSTRSGVARRPRGLVSEADYARDVQSAVQVLEGRNDEVQRNLAERMEHASERLEFERAAALRDQIAALKELQAQQVVAADDERDADVFAIAGDPGGYAVSVMPVRGGRSLGTSGFFPPAAFADPPEALSSFLMQYYSEQVPPARSTPTSRSRTPRLWRSASTAGREQYVSVYGRPFSYVLLPLQ